MKLHVAWIGFGALLVSGAAHAQDRGESEPRVDERAIGGRGRVVVDALGADSSASSGSLVALTTGFFGPLSLASDHYTQPASILKATNTVVGVLPSADVFLTDRLSIGGRAGVEWFQSTLDEGASAAFPTPSHTRTTGYVVTAAPRIGYAIPISPSFAFWPRVGAGFDLLEGNTHPGNGAVYAYFVEVNLGLVVRLAKHVTLDLGPVVSFRASDSTGDVQLLEPFGTGSSLQAGARAALRLDF